MKSVGVNNQTFIRIFIGVATIAYCVQFVSEMNFAKSVLTNVTTAILAGLLIYTLEILIAKRYLGNCQDLLWIPFKLNKSLIGILAFLVVLAITTLGVQQLDQHKIFSGYGDWLKYILIFSLNLVPSAMTEEWLFRFLPTILVSQKGKFYSILFYVGVNFLFMLMHLPKYNLEGNESNLHHVFIAGIAFLLVYQLTRNLPFVVLIHAFTNNGWFVYESTSNWLFSYAAIVVISISWGGFNFFKARSSNRRTANLINNIKTSGGDCLTK